MTPDRKTYGHGFGLSPANTARLTAEVISAAALTIVATGITPNPWGNIIDAAGIVLPLVETPGRLRKISKIKRERRVSVHTPLTWGMENLVADERTMFAKVDKWTSDMHGTINERLAASKKKELQDVLHMGFYSSMVMGGRIGLEVLSNVPHIGDGLEGFTYSIGNALQNHELLTHAWTEFQANPGLSFVQSCLVVGGIILSSLFNYQTQKRITGRLDAYNHAVDDTARRAKGKYDDSYLNLGERVFAKIGQILRRK